MTSTRWHLASSVGTSVIRTHARRLSERRLPADAPRWLRAAGVMSLNGGMLTTETCAAFTRPAATASAVSVLFIHGARLRLFLLRRLALRGASGVLIDVVDICLVTQSTSLTHANSLPLPRLAPAGLDNTMVPFAGGRFGGVANNGLVPATVAAAGDWATNNRCLLQTQQLPGMRLLPHLCAQPGTPDALPYRAPLPSPRQPHGRAFNGLLTCLSTSRPTTGAI